jgi:hypothetical protein
LIGGEGIGVGFALIQKIADPFVHLVVVGVLKHVLFEIGEAHLRLSQQEVALGPLQQALVVFCIQTEADGIFIDRSFEVSFDGEAQSP